MFAAWKTPTAALLLGALPCLVVNAQPPQANPAAVVQSWIEAFQKAGVTRQQVEARFGRPIQALRDDELYTFLTQVRADKRRPAGDRAPSLRWPPTKLRRWSPTVAMQLSADADRLESEFAKAFAELESAVAKLKEDLPPDLEAANCRPLRSSSKSSKSFGRTRRELSNTRRTSCLLPTAMKRS